MTQSQQLMLCRRCGSSTFVTDSGLCATCYREMRELHGPRTATKNRESLEKASVGSNLWLQKKLQQATDAAVDDMTMKDGTRIQSNLDPKAAAGSLKPQLQLVPPCFEEAVAGALQQGNERYGPWNWRSNQVPLMTYLGAIRRHLNAFLDGEDDAPDSGISHLGHIGASCAILLDAKKQGTLVDDRPKKAESACPRSDRLAAIISQCKIDCPKCGLFHAGPCAETQDSDEWVNIPDGGDLRRDNEGNWVQPKTT